jgi:DNA uptake protein ComE-like DNA-binding protein
MRATALVSLCVSLSILAACDPADSGEPTDRLSFSPIEIDAVLDLVNDPSTDAAFLDVEIGLESRAAQQIILARNGADGVYPSSDDHPFDTIEELDTVKYVGAVALEILRNYTIDNPAPSGAIVEGVEFTAAESSAVLFGVNEATLDELDIDAQLAVDSAVAIIENAPYDSLEQLAAVPNVGKGTLTQLRAYAPVWMDLAALAGTFDGVTFEPHDAADALELANHATYEQLVAGGVYSSGARALVDNRPYDDLADVAGVSGVGPSTMQALKSM